MLTDVGTFRPFLFSGTGLASQSGIEVRQNRVSHIG